MSKFRSLFVLKLIAFFITILSCISLYAVEYKDIQTVRRKEGYKAAFILLKQLAEQGNAQAQFELGAAYEHPLFDEPIKKDINEAIKWYRKAAIQINVDAQYSLGRIYFVYDDYKNYKESFIWCQKAAEQGLASAQNNLGVMYSEGEGTPKNYIQAFKWYKKAAEQGDSNAQYNLGAKYYHGEGTPKNYIEAHKWLNIASANEDKISDNARSLMNFIESKMIPEQIATAQSLAKEWVENH